jgi:hypothetical protein
LPGAAVKPISKIVLVVELREALKQHCAGDAIPPEEIQFTLQRLINGVRNAAGGRVEPWFCQE